jgi:hypothetical protein
MQRAQKSKSNNSNGTDAANNTHNGANNTHNGANSSHRVNTTGAHSADMSNSTDTEGNTTPSPYIFDSRVAEQIVSAAFPGILDHTKSSGNGGQNDQGAQNSNSGQNSSSGQNSNNGRSSAHHLSPHELNQLFVKQHNMGLFHNNLLMNGSGGSGGIRGIMINNSVNAGGGCGALYNPHGLLSMDAGLNGMNLDSTY